MPNRTWTREEIARLRRLWRYRDRAARSPLRAFCVAVGPQLGRTPTAVRDKILYEGLYRSASERALLREERRR